MVLYDDCDCVSTFIKKQFYRFYFYKDGLMWHNQHYLLSNIIQSRLLLHNIAFERWYQLSFRLHQMNQIGSGTKRFAGRITNNVQEEDEARDCAYVYIHVGNALSILIA